MAYFGGVVMLFFDDPPKPGEHPSVNALLDCFIGMVATLVIPLLFQLCTRRTMSTAQISRWLLICAAAYTVPFLIPTLDWILNV